MNRYIVIIAVFVLLVAMLGVGLTRDPGELESTYIDKQAPGFDLPSLANPMARVNNASMAGGPALVNVWGTWCPGCRDEHPFLMQLEAANVLPIFGINWRDDRAAALAWLEQYGDPYVDSGFDADGRVGIDWGVYGAPETFLVSAEGIVLHRYAGPLNPVVWEQEFMPLLQAEDAKQ